MKEMKVKHLYAKPIVRFSTHYGTFQINLQYYTMTNAQDFQKALIRRR
jgi:hypothetical protein